MSSDDGSRGMLVDDVEGSESSQHYSPVADQAENGSNITYSELYPAIKCRWVMCGEWFSGLNELAAHVSHTHAVAADNGLFYCSWEGCSRSHRGFNARYKMLVHVRTHTNEKPHHCFKCNKSFSRAENLKIHARSHTGEKPYICPVPGCHKAYSNSSDRFKHTRTHSIEKPYTCKVPGCNKRYTDPSSLRKHAKTYNHFLLTQHTHLENKILESENTEMRMSNSPPQLDSHRVQIDCVAAHLTSTWLQLYPRPVWLEEQDTPLDLTTHTQHAHYH